MGLAEAVAHGVVPVLVTVGGLGLSDQAIEQIVLVGAAVVGK